MQLVLQLATLVLCISPAASVSSDMVADLQLIVDNAAKAINASVSFAVSHSSMSLALAAGTVDGGVTNTTTSDRYGWGSVTKTVTGAAVLKLVEEGKLSLDDPAHRYIDPMLQKWGFAYDTMEELFSVDRWQAGGSSSPTYNASEITVRHLMTMQSGVPDYDTDAFRHIQYSHGNWDFSPADLLDWIHGPLLFKPGSIPPASVMSMQPGYSSMNFVLLGYVLCYFQKAPHWTDLKQGSVVPSSIDGIHFANSGTFSQYVAPVHGFDRFSFAAEHSSTGVFDVSNTSAAGGWTGGNIIMAPQAAAAWILALYGPGETVLRSEYQQLMVPKAGTPGRSYYGMATMNLTGLFGQGSGAPLDWSAYGHLGDTYGFSGVAVYFAQEEMSITFGSNVEGAQMEVIKALCQTYNRVKDEIANVTPRTCEYTSSHGMHHFGGACNCSPYA